MTLSVDLLHPSAEHEKRTHKKKRLVQSPNSYFMDVKCPGCFNISVVFSHAQTVVLCGSCSNVLCQPTGGRARLTEGCSFRKKKSVDLVVVSCITASTSCGPVPLCKLLSIQKCKSPFPPRSTFFCVCDRGLFCSSLPRVFSNHHSTTHSIFLMYFIAEFQSSEMEVQSF